MAQLYNFVDCGNGKAIVLCSCQKVLKYSFAFRIRLLGFSLRVIDVSMSTCNRTAGEVSWARKESGMNEGKHAVDETLAGCKRRLHDDPKKSLKCNVLVYTK